MTAQLALFQDDTIKKTIVTVPINQLKLSRFNPRNTRPNEDIDKLTERISRNGFEITRALWAYRNGNGYEVFAGGTRLEAVKRAGLGDVPIVLHESLTDEDIVRLADEDNENDEYHAKVGPVDVWAHYARLRGEGWTQERIARAKGVKQAIISKRLKLYELADSIKTFIHQQLLDEAHLIEILRLFIDEYLNNWLTSTQAHLELATKAVNDKSKNGKKTVKAVKADVDTWKAFIKEAERIYDSFNKDITAYDLDKDPPKPYLLDAQGIFIKGLVEREARSMTAVKAAAREVRLHIKQNLEDYEVYIKQQSAKAAAEALQAQREEKLLAKFVQDDCLEVLKSWQAGKIHLLLIDPPYGKEYQSNRRWASNAPDKIKGDNEQEAIGLLRDALLGISPHLVGDAHLLIFCDWQHEPKFRETIESIDLKVKGSLVWVKEEHSAGDVKGTFGPSHERIIHAVKGSPDVTPRIRDVLDCARTRETDHPNEKPIELLTQLVKSTSNEGDLVVDLFAGCASTLVAAMRLKRDFFGAEIDANYHEAGCARLLKELQNAE